MYFGSGAAAQTEETINIFSRAIFGGGAILYPRVFRVGSDLHVHQNRKGNKWVSDFKYVALVPNYSASKRRKISRLLTPGAPVKFMEEVGEMFE